METDPILVVEDDLALRDELRDLLNADGYAVAEAGNGWEALEYLRGSEGRCGLVVLDIMLPIMTGWELLARMRGDPKLQDTPVIIMSARPVAQVADGPPVFHKPFPPEQLLDAVRRHRRT